MAHVSHGTCRTTTDADAIHCFVNTLQSLVLEWRELGEDQQSARLREAVDRLPAPRLLPARMILSCVVSSVVRALSNISDAEGVEETSRLRARLLACLPVDGLDAHPQIRLAIQGIRTSFGDASLNTRTMARRVGLSPSHFGRLFKKVMGGAFVHLLRRHRIVVAIELLHQGRLSVKEVAGAVGYKHVADFDRHFKLETGICPTMIRRGGDRHMGTLSALRGAIGYTPNRPFSHEG